MARRIRRISYLASSVGSPPIVTRISLAVVALLTLLIYGLSLDTDVGFWDTGELQVVPYILGLAHPSGNPTGILVGWIWVHVFCPFGEPALRENLLWAFGFVIAAVSLCAAAIAYRVRSVIATASAIAFAFSLPTWSHATHADVLDLGVALCAIAFLAVILAVERERPLLRYAAVAAGFALGTHGVVLWYLPALAVLAVRAPYRTRIRELVGCVTIAILVALAVYAYLPIRSAIVTANVLDPTRALGLPSGQPFWDWGHPALWAGFWHVVSGSSVGTASALGDVFQPARWPAAARFAVDQLVGFASPPLLAVLLVLAICGAVYVRTGWALLMPLILVSPFAQSFTAESDAMRYFIFPMWCVWLLVAIALDRSIARQRARKAFSIAIYSCVTLLCVAEVVMGREQFAVHGDRLGSTYISAVIRYTPNNAVVIAPWVYGTPLGYAAYVRHSMGSRTVVVLGESQMSPHVRHWLSNRPVYVVSEHEPAAGVPAHLLVAFRVNPDPVHDPKLYELKQR